MFSGPPSQALHLRSHLIWDLCKWCYIWQRNTWLRSFRLGTVKSISQVTDIKEVFSKINSYCSSSFTYEPAAGLQHVFTILICISDIRILLSRSQDFRHIVKKEYVLFLSLLNLLSLHRLPMDMSITTHFEKNPVCYLSIFVNHSLPKTPFGFGVWCFFVWLVFCVDFFWTLILSETPKNTMHGT